LLGVPGQQIPHDLDARATAYRGLLAGTRTLVVLDNAADVEQVRPLLPETSGCLTLVTSRRSLTELTRVSHLTVDVFTRDEALELLTQAAPHVSVGDDPDAAARIAERCGYLPLALGLVAGHMRAKPGWTMTDHADWLDECHTSRRLDTGVELALELSYQHLPVDRRPLLRLLALHPGQDFDAYAAAALADTDLDTAQTRLDQLRDDHLLQQRIPGRYIFHDLIRAYATTRAHDEDRPAERRTALTRLFDHYLASAAAAMNTLHPAETHRRPRISPPDTPTPDLTDPDTALAWLDTEQHTLISVAAHTASHGWPDHTNRLSTILFRYLHGGHPAAALAVHGHSRDAAQVTDDPASQAHALTHLATAHVQLGHHELAAELLQQALHLFRQIGDPAGQARALNNLGNVEERLGHYQPAADHVEQAVTLYRQAGDQTGATRALLNLGVIEGRLGRSLQAADHFKQAMTLFQQIGDRDGEGHALLNLGYAEILLRQYTQAADHLQQALTLYRQLGNRDREARARDSLGILHTCLGQPAQATEHHQQALIVLRETGSRGGEACALNGLGEAAHAAGRHVDALTHHTTAHHTAADIGDRDQQARAHKGLGHAYHTLGNHDRARHHYQHALALYTDLGKHEADRILERLETLDNTSREMPQ
jgi:tetratricopeptide (TPR) repeat protein